jgi:hypothetical protein
MSDETIQLLGNDPLELSLEAPPYYVVSGSAPDYAKPLVTKVYFSDLPVLEILLHFFQNCCTISRGEAAKLLEEGNYSVSVVRTGEGAPEILTLEDMNFPWLQVEALTNNIDQLETGLQTLKSLAALNSIPGAPALFEGADPATAEKFLNKLRSQRDKITNDWIAVRSDVGARPLRDVKIDRPDEEHDIPF